MIISFLFGLISFLVYILFIVFSDTFIIESKNAFLFFIHNIFPVIFPFFVLSSIYSKSNIAKIFSKPFIKLTKKIFKIDSSIIIESFVSSIIGYPAGAKICGDLYTNNLISKQAASIISTFTNNPSPFFVILIIGKRYLNCSILGLKIWVSIILSTLIIAVILHTTLKRNQPIDSFIHNNVTASHQNKSFDINIFNSIINALNTALYVGAVMIFFATILSLLGKLFPSNGIFFSLIYTFSELTGGLLRLDKLISSNNFYPYILCAFCAWSGLSAHMQVCGILSSYNISSKNYMITKVLSPIISPIIFFLLNVSRFF